MTPSFGSTEAGAPSFAQNCKRKNCRNLIHNSMKTHVSTRFFALTAFGRQWYRPTVPRKFFTVHPLGGSVDVEAVFAGSRPDACAP